MSYRTCRTICIFLSLLLGTLLGSPVVHSQESPIGQWVLITTPELLPVAQPLIEKRKQQRWDVLVKTSQQEPSRQGKTDAASSAETLRHWLAKASSSFKGKTCVLLLGTWESKFPTAQVLPLNGTHGRMKNRPTDHGFSNPNPNGTSSFAIGRLPARNADEAEAMIRKLLTFESAQFDVNQVNLFVAHPGGSNEFQKNIAANFVAAAVESRLQKLGTRWHLECVMDIANTEHSVTPDKFGLEIKRLLSEGHLFSVFSGHSNAMGVWSQLGNVVPRADFASLKPKGPGGVLISCGCYGCQISGALGQGYGISAIRSKTGPCAVIGAYDESYSVAGLLAFDGFLSQLILAEPPTSLGDYWLAIQQGITRGEISNAEFMMHDMVDGSGGTASLEDQRLEHAEMWTLLGDPAMTLPILPAKN